MLMKLSQPIGRHSEEPRMPTITRDVVVKALWDALEPLSYVYAMWEGGSASFRRVDEWSDIDLSIDVDDDYVSSVLTIVEQTLQTLSPIALRYQVAQPTWHGQSQM